MRDIRELKRVVGHIDELRKISRAVHKIDEAACNGELTTRQTNRLRRLLIRARKLAQGCGCDIYHQSDPRGVALWLGDDKINCMNYTDYMAL